MTTRRNAWLGRGFLACGAYALLCIPAIFLAEAKQWPESFWHTTQLLAALGCFASAAAFLLSGRGPRRAGRPSRSAMTVWAKVAVVLSGGWLLVWGTILTLLVLGGDDF